ncbi:MAG: HAD-IA family hydrolase [Actinomycetota bacterium]
MRYRAVFFDAGETLLSPHPSFPDLLSTVLKRQGFDVEPEAIRGQLHVISGEFSKESAAGWSTSPERSRAFWSSLYRTLLGALEVPYTDTIAAAIYETFTDLSSYRTFPDVVPALRVLRRAGLRLGLISNFEQWLERLLEEVGLTEFFDVVAISGVEGLEKPDPRIFRLALERGGVEPNETAYVGDSPEFDTKPAEALGMAGVLLDRRGRFPDHRGTRITSLEELPEVLARAGGGGGGSGVMAEREYGVDEANALLPEMARALEDIRQARQVVLARGERIRGTAPSNGGGAFSQEVWDALATLRRELEMLSERGIVLRDPESGLIDFPSRRDGAPVFLCWRLGEDRVGYWHGPDSGFAGRRPL